MFKIRKIVKNVLNSPEFDWLRLIRKLPRPNVISVLCGTLIESFNALLIKYMINEGHWNLWEGAFFSANYCVLLCITFPVLKITKKTKNNEEIFIRQIGNKVHSRYVLCTMIIYPYKFDCKTNFHSISDNENEIKTNGKPSRNRNTYLQQNNIVQTIMGWVSDKHGIENKVSRSFSACMRYTCFDIITQT